MKMNKNHKTVLVILNIIVSFLISSCSSPKEQVRIGNGTFTIEGKDIQLICGEMHYPRIPHEYWRDRLKRARAMGLNTVSAYVFWNFHERQPGEFDFSGQADIAEFIRTAQEEGLYVILRPGPYVCAEWDFGGYPSWLLKGFFVKFGGNLFFISTVFFFLNPIKSCRYVCFLVTLKTPHH